MSLYKLLVYGGLGTIGISGFFVISGVILIRLGLRVQHKWSMIVACAFALVFVVLYLTRSSMFPPRGYTGDHRTLYLSILWSHTALSLINLPMVIITINEALRNRFNRHKKVAPYTAGVWIYVALTGWLIYFFLR